MNLRAQRGEPQVDLFNLQLIAFRICVRKKLLISIQCLLVRPEIIMCRRYEKVGSRDFGLLPGQPLIFRNRVGETFLLVERNRQVRVGSILRRRNRQNPAQDGFCVGEPAQLIQS